MLLVMCKRDCGASVSPNHFDHRMLFFEEHPYMEKMLAHQDRPGGSTESHGLVLQVRRLRLREVK